MEAQLKATHNIALVSLEEAKGTLLEFDKITLVEHPRPALNPARRNPRRGVRCSRRRPWRSNEAPATHFEPKPAPVIPIPTVAAQGRTTTFQATIQIGVLTDRNPKLVRPSPRPRPSTSEEALTTTPRPAAGIGVQARSASEWIGEEGPARIGCAPSRSLFPGSGRNS